MNKQTLEPEEAKDFIAKLNAQHPTTWYKGAAYDAINPITGKTVKIRRAQNYHGSFLHIYVPLTVVLRSASGEELSRRPGHAHYRANLRTNTIERID